MKHVHVWGAVEHSRFAGTPNRRCQFCSTVSLDLDPSEDLSVHYHADMNLIGYLPMSDEPPTFSTWESAQGYMLDELDRSADHYFAVAADDDADEYKNLADELSSEMEDLNLSDGPEWGTQVGNTAYWIIQCTETECETEDQ